MNAAHVKVKGVEFSVDYRFSPEEIEDGHVKWPAVIELDSVEHGSDDLTELLAEYVLDQIRDELLENETETI